MSLRNRKYLCLTGTFFVLLLLLSGLPRLYAAGDDLEGDRPRIGLALGGGSALGFSHIGVLLWLEEHRIPVDYVSGTSMGGLIGGCYAMGMTPQEISDLVMGIDWRTLFNPNLPYKNLDFRRKADRRQYPVSAEVGLDLFGVKLPTGIFSHQVDLLLSRLTLPYSTVGRFDELPLPFSCIGTDIDRAETVVMEDGSLVEALRATMAVPGVFTPVLREGRLLVDGGLLKNVPADVIREKGLDQVIAVELIPNNPQDQTGFGVAMRTINTVVIAGSRRTREFADVLISPEVHDLSLMDWGRAEELIARGYQAAEHKKADLLQFAVDEETWADYLYQREARRRTAPVPEELRIDGLEQTAEAEIRTKLEKILYQPVDTIALEAELMELLGTGLYESFRYECKKEGEKTLLVVTAVPKAHGHAVLNFGVELDGELLHGQETAFAVESRATFFNLLYTGTEGRLDLRIGTEPSFAGEWCLPVMDSSWFIRPMFSTGQKNLSIYQGDLRLSAHRILQDECGIDVGYTFDRVGEVRWGYSLGAQKTQIKVGSPIDLEGDGTVSKARFEIEYDRLDHAFLPQAGGRVNLTNTWFFKAPGTDGPFGQSEGECLWIFPVGQKNFFFTRVASGVTWQGEAPLIQEFRLGGSFRFSAYQDGMLTGDNYFLGDIGFLRSLKESALFGQDLYFGIWWEQGGVFPRWSDPKTESVISIGLLGSTLLGPVNCYLSFREGEDPYLYLGLGRIF